MAKDYTDILVRIRERRTMGEDNIQAEKDAIEADIAPYSWQEKERKRGTWGFYHEYKSS